jgi:hypothetical protein
MAEGVPIRTNNFAVYVNRYRVTPKKWSGNRIPVMEGTKYGIIHGEIVILPASRASTENMGIEIEVKGVTVRRELFNIASWDRAATRIRGEIHADFLPLTSDRSGFIEDTPEFEAFLKEIQKIIADVERVYKQLASKKENQKVSRALKEALQRFHQALSLNPGPPSGVVPLAEKGRHGAGKTAVESDTGDEAPETIKAEDEIQSDLEMETISQFRPPSDNIRQKTSNFCQNLESTVTARKQIIFSVHNCHFSYLALINNNNFIFGYWYLLGTILA